MKSIKKVSLIFILSIMYFNPSAEAQSTYNDVANIFYTHCTKCHHDNQVAYFSLLTYNDAFNYYPTIQQDLITSHMPPWFADTAYTTTGHAATRFLHEDTLTMIEKNKILQWINDGSLEGNSQLAPTPPAYNTKYKLNGIASLTLQIPTFTSNSSLSNEFPYNSFSIPSGLTTDKWLQAFEVVPGNNPAVHSVIVTLDTVGTSQSNTSGYCVNQPNEIYLGGWTPSANPTIFPNQPSLKSGIKIPAGSKIIIRVHYTSGSGGKVDSTKIRMFFYPENETGIRPIHSDAFIQYWGKQGVGGADILANTIKSISATPAIQTLPHPIPPTSDISLLSIYPLSRNICTKINDYAFNGNDTIPLIRFSLWDYEWEGNYCFSKLLKIPASYTLKADRLFDNTASNQHQPNNPLIDINFGTSALNEMLFDTFQWLDYQAGDELIDLKALIAADTLLTVGINNISIPTGIQFFVYPNPATDKINIYLSKKSEYKGQIYNITGQNILQIETFKEVITIDVKNIPAGIYIIEITDIKSNESITKKMVITN
jgi:hypothetical protein